MKLFLDMDGVIVNFLGGASKAHNRPLPYDIEENRGIWETETLWGISAEDFWAPINADRNFWANLEKTPEADEIMKLCTEAVGIANVAILTSPDRSANCFAGKIEWMFRHYPQLEGRMIFSRAKNFMSSPQRILVDDKDANCNEFRKEGGNAILIPRLWNSAHRYADRVVPILKGRLLEVLPE